MIFRWLIIFHIIFKRIIMIEIIILIFIIYFSISDHLQHLMTDI